MIPLDLNRKTNTQTAQFHADYKMQSVIDEMGWFFGASRSMAVLRQTVRQMSNSRSSVLLCGENGVGKSVLARIIHGISGVQGRFITFDVGSVPLSLLETELAYAMQNAARDGEPGTLHLSGIEYLPQVLQQRLLQHYRSNYAEASPMRPPARLICSSRYALSEAVEQGLFSERLYQDIQAVNMFVPPLRERPEDIPLLAQYIVQKYAGNRQVRLSKDALALLQNYSWPGNMREMAGVVQKSVGQSPRHVLGVEDFQPHMESEPANDNSQPLSLPDATEVCLSRYFDNLRGMAPAPNLFERVINEVEKPLIEHVLRYVRGNQLRAAEVLGINRNTLRKKIRQLEIDAKKPSGE